MDSVRLLYVEDDPTDRELTLRYLRQHAPDLEVRVVGTGREAREVVAGQRFDLVLLDYRLPDVDGLQLLQEFLTTAPNVPVIMVTGSGDHEVAVAALKAGAMDYVIKKPGHLDRLPAVVRETLGRSQYERSRRTCELRILYAEHNPADVDLTQRYLSAHAVHLNIEAVNTGAVALRKLEADGYDLVLLDYRMPDMNGLEILQEIRERGIHVPVVIVTGHGDEEIAVQTLKLGASDYVVKREGYLTQLPSTIESAVAQWALANEKEVLLVLNGIARIVASTLDLDEVLRRVTSAATTLLRVERSLVSLLSEDGAELIPAAWLGGPAEVAGRLRFRVGQDIPGRAAAERRAVSVRDIRLQDTAIYQEEAVLEGIGGLLSVPIVAHDRLLGVLTAAAAGPRTFTIWEEALLTALAAHAAVGIENATLYKELNFAAIQLEATVEERTRQLEEALRRAETASRHKSEFLANMSHELRTPLNAILGFSELLQDPAFGPLIEKQGRYVGHIHSSGKHLLALINDLLDLSKVEAGRLELRPEPFTLADALTAALEPFRVQVDAKGMALSLHLGEAPGTLVADPLRFKQILYNLLSNAVKFTPAGGSITVTVKMVSRSESGVSSSQPETQNSKPEMASASEFVEIAVQDTGIGIKAEDLSRLFQEFTQLDSSLAKPQQGTGLGLALTKRLVDLHGGSVTATSPGEGQGSTFTVTLPLRPS
jgi:signal transduction histidine kinase/DNA-binding response OmpR family regulator